MRAIVVVSPQRIGADAVIGVIPMPNAHEARRSAEIAGHRDLVRWLYGVEWFGAPAPTAVRERLPIASDDGFEYWLLN